MGLPDSTQGVLGQGPNPWELGLESWGEGLWEWNLVTGEQRHSRRWTEMLGYAPGEIATHFSDFLAHVHPQDVDQLKDAEREHRKNLARGGAVEFRLRCKDGSWKWVLSRTLVVERDAQGQPLKMLGTHTDISERKRAQAELQTLNQRLARQASELQTTLASISQGILMVDGQGRVSTFNPRLCELLDLPEALLARHPLLDEVIAHQKAQGEFSFGGRVIDPRTGEAIPDLVAGAGGDLPDHYLRQTRSGRTLAVRTHPLPDGGLVRTFTDITDYVQAEADRQRLGELLESTQAISRVGGWEVDLANGKVFWTEQVHRMLDTTPQEFMPTPQSVLQFFTPQALATVQASYADVVDQPRDHEFEIEMITANGRHIWVHSKGTTRWEDGRPVKRTATVQDITEQKQSEALIWQQAHFDVLTGLPNRHMLRDRLEQDIKKCKRDGLQLAVLFIDLDHFKEVNDTLGHGAGDQLLVEAARRIRSCVREADTVARMGGDEFTVILSELLDVNHLERILQALLDALARVFKLGQEQVFISASVGVTIYPLDATLIEDLFKNADQALYVAKGDGRNRYSFFTPALQEAAQTRARLAADLRTGLTGAQFQVLYQPIVELVSGAVHKAEALIRWHHPTRGSVSPADFIPIAESTGQILEIGDWVFEQAAQQVLEWRNAIDPKFQISVNRSPVQFQHSSANTRWIDHLRALGLPGDCLSVEITEGLLLDTSASVTAQLLELHDAGVQVSLDDFGTGYSSLSYLQRFDIDFLKIDKSFISHLVADSTDLVLCKAIIVMAHELGMKVIAEGVETAQQRDLLLQAGCDYAQGYLFSRPLSVPAFEAFIQSSDRTRC